MEILKLYMIELLACSNHMFSCYLNSYETVPTHPLLKKNTLVVMTYYKVSYVFARVNCC